MPRRRQSERLLSQVGELRTRAREAKDDELKAILVKMACVLLSGYVEKRIEEILSDFVERRSSSPPVQRAALWAISNTNMTPRRIIDVLDRFSNDWAKQFEEGLHDDQRASLTAIVTTRNAIAHGDAQTMTWSSLDDHESRLVQVMENIRFLVLGA